MDSHSYLLSVGPGQRQRSRAGPHESEWALTCLVTPRFQEEGKAVLALGCRRDTLLKNFSFPSSSMTEAPSFAFLASIDCFCTWLCARTILYAEDTE